MKKQKSKKTKIILSILALAEVVVLAAGITFSWIEGGNRGYINGKDIQISTGSGLTMIKDGPSERRKFVDNALCQLKSNYSELLKNYNRTLIQRNSLLKKSESLEQVEAFLDVWDINLAKTGS